MNNYSQSIFRHIPATDRSEIFKRIIKSNLNFYQTKYPIKELEDISNTELAGQFLKFFYASVGKDGGTLDKEKRLVHKFFFSFPEIRDKAVTEINTSFSFYLEHYFSVRVIKILNKNILFTTDQQIKDDIQRKDLIKKYKLIIENNTDLCPYINRKITEVKNFDDKFISFEFFDNSIEILERITVLKDPKTKKENSIFVKYIIDFKRGFLEFQWNKSSIKNLTQHNRSVNPEGVINDFKLIDYLQNNLEKWFKLSFSDETIFSSKEANSQTNDLSNFRAKNIVDAVKKSPLEAILFHLFIEDHNNVLTKIKAESDSKLNFSELKKQLIDFFGPQQDFQEAEIEESVQFIENLNLSKKATSIDFLASNSYIYSFTLRDIVNYTSSRTKNDKKEPIYVNEPYWYLLNIVKRVKLITELSFHFEMIGILKQRSMQKFTISAKNNILFFDYLQKKHISDEDTKARYISKSRRDISEHFKDRINEFINEQSGISERISST